MSELIFSYSGLRPGLASAGFKRLGRQELVSLAKSASLEGIEWGGDFHAPQGDKSAALEAGLLTRDAGMELAAYGSTYRLGDARQVPRFEAVLDSAMAMEAPLIRVWAGSKGGEETSAEEFDLIIKDALRITAMARSQGIRVGLDYHGSGPADSVRSTLRLLGETDGLLCFWQPPAGKSQAACLEGLKALNTVRKLANLHVLQCWPDAEIRHPLSHGEGRWKEYLKEAAKDGLSRYCCLESVKNDSPGQMLRDAQVLRRILNEIQSCMPEVSLE